MTNIAIIGVGYYSLAIALKCAYKTKNNITMWTESDELYNNYIKTNKVKFYNEELPNNIKITNDYKTCLDNKDIIFIITGSEYINDVINNIKNYYNKKTPIVIASKGIDMLSKKTLSEVVKDKLHTNNISIISGPTFAVDLYNNNPCSLAIASYKKKNINYIKSILENDTLKLRKSSDIIGVQLCGAIKNVIAIGSGVLSGLGYSESTRAFYINESLHDIKHIISKLGGKKKTVLSYAGIGDLVLTCSSEKSRNFKFGYILSTNKKDTKKYLNENTVEGYNTLKELYPYLKEKNINTGVIEIIYNIVFNNYEPYELHKFLITKN